MGERITFRRNEGLRSIHPHWRGNPTVNGKFFNRQHRWKPGVGSVLKWRFSLILSGKKSVQSSGIPKYIISLPWRKWWVIH